MYQPATRRAGPALAAAGVVALVVAALWLGLAGAPTVPERDEGLRAVMVDVPPPPPPLPKPAPSPTPVVAPKAGGSPRGSPPPVLAVPEPALRLPAPVAAAPVPGSGSGLGATGAGAGSGQGGSGGSGGNGRGYGSGMERPAVLPRQIAGRLRWADLPDDLRRTRRGSDLTLTYRIGTDGRVSGCRVLVSSGRPELDEETCSLLTARFRFRPARDEAGRAVAYAMIETHGWDTASGP